MGNTLDVSGLNGLKVGAHQVGAELNVTPGPSGTFMVSATGNQDLTSVFSSPSRNATAKTPVTLGFGNQSRFTPRNSPFNLAFSYSFYIKQPSHSPILPTGYLYKAVGWNADSILLFGRYQDSIVQYFVISDKNLVAGTPSDLVFGTTGPAPTIDGVTPAITCFAAGTRIATMDGLAAVEHLAAGDLVRTVSGTLQPIIWVGHRHVSAAAHVDKARVMPVRIAAGAFGVNLPACDLLLSPEHAVFTQGVLVPVHALVNGTTIRQVAMAAVDYYHIELARHDAVLAEGLPVETYLDTGSRHGLATRKAAAA